MSIKFKLNLWIAFFIANILAFPVLGIIFKSRLNNVVCIIGLVIMAILTVLLSYVYSKIIWKHIKKSENPRHALWEVFILGHISLKELSKIPAQTKIIDNYRDSYSIYDKNNRKTVRLFINKDYIRIKNICSKLMIFQYSEIDQVKICTSFRGKGKLGLMLEIIVNNEIIEYTDITNVDFPIDELEQVLNHFCPNYVFEISDRRSYYNKKYKKRTQ